MMKPIDNKRWQFIKAFGASLVLLNSGYIATSFSASNKKQGNKKLVWVVLRGAMDSLDTVVPTFDNSLASLRPKLQQGLKAHLLPLDDGYALHPSLVHFKQLYKDKQLLPIVAVGSGYGARSHFDGQDYLESGYLVLYLKISKLQLNFQHFWMKFLASQDNILKQLSVNIKK